MSAAEAPPSLRDRRKQETRNDIRRVALQLVRDRGYDAVTVDLICKHAGVSVRTFFNYFASKDTALIAVPPPLPESAVDEFLASSGTLNVFAELADVVVRMFEEAGSAALDFQTSIQIVMGVPTLAKLQHGVLAERESDFVELVAQRLGVDPADVRPAVIAAALTGAIRIACQRWSLDPEANTLPDEIRACLTVLSTS